jgi:RES domain-containing protein
VAAGGFVLAGRDGSYPGQPAKGQEVVRMGITEFESYRSYREFALSVTRQWRYSRTPKQAAFLEALLETSVTRQEVIPSATRLWRSQLDHAWHLEDLGGGVVEELPTPCDVARMKPLLDRAREGRANPKGIPHLYLATDHDTAVAEARPWIGSYVSIAQFALTRDVRVVKCVTDDHRMMMYLQEPKPEERERAVWRDIDRAFCEPVTHTDDTADYAPSQIVAEFFRENGLDGVAYGSSLGPGHNVVLFDTEAATLVNCGLVQVRAVKLDLSLAANPYFVAGATGPD